MIESVVECVKTLKRSRMKQNAAFDGRQWGPATVFSQRYNNVIKTFQQRFSQHHEIAYQILIIMLLERSINVILHGVRLVSSIHVLLKGEMLLSIFILCEITLSVFLFSFYA